MATGAALPKTCEGHKPRGKRKGKMVAVICADCGEGRTKGWFTPKQARQACEEWGCKCGGPLVPCQPDDCAELTPHLMSEHRVFIEAEQRPMAKQANADLCEGCGWPRPETGNPDYWYCPKCQGVNGRRDDGSLSYTKAGFRSYEWERAMGMRLDRPERKARPGKAAVRVAPSVDDIPF